MKKNSLLVMAIVLAFGLTGCASMNQKPFNFNNKYATGNKFSDTMVTPDVANSMNSSDKSQLAQLINTANAHQVVTWRNHGDMYEFTSLNIFVNEQGKACRNYKIRSLIDDRESTMQGTACRAADANWLGVNVS